MFKLKLFLLLVLLIFLTACSVHTRSIKYPGGQIVTETHMYFINPVYIEPIQPAFPVPSNPALPPKGKGST